MGNITVIGLGPDREGFLTEYAMAHLRESGCRVLRTQRHCAAEWLQKNGLAFETLDDVYEESDDFDMLNEKIVEKLCDMAREGEVLYAVPGAGDASDETVRLLCAAGAVREIIPGVSADAALLAAAMPKKIAVKGNWLRCSAQELDQIDLDAAPQLLVTELTDRILAGEVKIRLLEYYPDEHPAILLHRGRAKEIALYELDHAEEIDHTTAIFLPAAEELTAKYRYGMHDFLSVMETLRAPDGCPWDSVQTHHSMERYLVEEAYEALDAIRREDADAMTEELGDLLLQIVFHASIGAQFDEFTWRDVTSRVTEKMIGRHPRLFGGEADDLSWEEMKRREKGIADMQADLHDVPRALPALARAQKVLKRSGASAEGASVDTLAEKLLLLCAEANRSDISLESELDLLTSAFIVYIDGSERDSAPDLADFLRKSGILKKNMGKT